MGVGNLMKRVILATFLPPALYVLVHSKSHHVDERCESNASVVYTLPLPSLQYSVTVA